MQATDPNTSIKALQALLDGYRLTSLVYMAAKLGIADLLKDGALSSEQLAASLGADMRAFHRILRALVAIGILSEDPLGQFRLTEIGKCLQSDVPGSMKGLAVLCGEERMPAWRDLAYSAMTGESAFNHVFGTSNWDFRRQHPDLNDFFNSTTQRRTKGVAPQIIEAYDFLKFHTIADVGGGHGILLTDILKTHVSARGILFDQMHVVAWAKRYLDGEGITERCLVEGGDMFESIPGGADLHILKSVLHDWQDTSCLTILRNCHRALMPHGCC
jgi:hypothetical protein